VRIRAAVIDSIVAHAREEAPNECCGLLIGPDDSIEDSVRTRNLEASPTRYRVDPEEHIALNRRLRRTPWRVVGAYHSHPHSAAQPSPTDVTEAFYPEYLYVIVSLAHPDEPAVCAYQITAGNFEPVVLVRVP
jgi:[CysO sulfur-carrier protein]-S-L-cysteine hydrolase